MRHCARPINVAYDNAPRTIYELPPIFPWQSYLPPDRLFGRLRVITKETNDILPPEAYKELYFRVGEIRRNGKDVLQIKRVAHSLKELEWEVK
jgi:hypothetical protein